MSARIDYYFSLISPWTYLGHERAVALAQAHGAQLVPHPIDVGRVFAATGGLPLAQRAPERRAYRLLELRRWRDHLGIPLVLEPRHFPADERLAAGMVYALRESGGDALALAGALLRAVWAEERDIAERTTLLEIAAGIGADGPALLAEAEAGRWDRPRERETREAIEQGVFGAPSYRLGEELFWGQDRLEFLDRALAARAPSA